MGCARLLRDCTNRIEAMERMGAGGGSRAFDAFFNATIHGWSPYCPRRSGLDDAA